jgi:hypothetical protein
MNRFSQFDIKPPERVLEGDKIKISRILNREVVVHRYRLTDSKVKSFQEKGSGKCLQLQVSFNNEMHVVFTSGRALIETIEQIPEDKFPFATTIIDDNGMFKFT